MKTVGFVIGGYLLGSILFGEIFLRLLKGKDIRKEGSDGNPGTFNAFAEGGVLCGTLTLLCDVGKGALPVFLYLQLNGEKPFSMPLALIMLAPVFGHAFPVYTKFRGGGKAIAVSFGALLGLLPCLLPVSILAFFYLLYSALKINPHSRRSILTFLCSAATAFFLLREPAVKLGMALISLVVIARHHPFRKPCGEDGI